MSKNWVFIAGTDYRRRIPDIFVQISAYYEALLRHEVTCCFYCNNFHPTAFCLPADFSAATVNLFFSLMDRPFHMITPYDDLVQFVRLCGFLLVSEAFLFHHLASPVVNGYLPRAILPLIWECYQNGFFRLSSYLFFSAYGCHIPWQIFHSAKSYRSFVRHFHNYRRALGIPSPFWCWKYCLPILSFQYNCIHIFVFLSSFWKFVSWICIYKFLSKSVGIITRSLFAYR